MKLRITLCFFLTLVLKAVCQSDSILKYTYNPENIVASAIDGTWKSMERERQLTFKKDTTVLRLLSPKYYAFNEKPIYHAGYMSYGEHTDLVFLLIENYGNPCVVFFEEKDGDIHLKNGAYLFIARGSYKDEDKLILVGDHATEPTTEFIRIE